MSEKCQKRTWRWGPKGAHFEADLLIDLSPTIVVRRFGHEHD